MSVLLIGADEKQRIGEAVEKARASVIPWTALQHVASGTPSLTMSLSERHPLTEDTRKLYPAQSVMLGTYRAAVSFEEQPAGVFRHLSVSSRARGMIPGLEVMKIVAETFGFTGFPPIRAGRVWNEEFAPGQWAINLIEIEP